jgi:ribose-phosphate pyrophosphokinase
MRNLVVLGGSSHPTLTKSICTRLGVPECKAILGKFTNGETSVQILESVRDKDVFIITTGAGEINEILMELFIMVNACKIAPARRTSSLYLRVFVVHFMSETDIGEGVITVLPVFPYSRQPDVPYVWPDMLSGNAPAMLFRDSFTVPSAPGSPSTALTIPDWEKENVGPLKQVASDNVTTSANLTDRSNAPGGSGPAASYHPFLCWTNCSERRQI